MGRSHAPRGGHRRRCGSDRIGGPDHQPGIVGRASGTRPGHRVGDTPGHTDDVFIEGESRAEPVSGDDCDELAAAQIKTTYRQSKKNRRTGSQNETHNRHSTVMHNAESSSQSLRCKVSPSQDQNQTNHNTDNHKRKQIRHNIIMISTTATPRALS